MTIFLSSKRLIPYMTISYKKKVEGLFAKVDDIEAMLTKHYGTVYTDKDKFVKEVLDHEKKTWAMPGEKFIELSKNGTPEFII